MLVEFDPTQTRFAQTPGSPVWPPPPSTAGPHLVPVVFALRDDVSIQPSTPNPRHPTAAPLATSSETRR